MRYEFSKSGIDPQLWYIAALTCPIRLYTFERGVVFVILSKKDNNIKVLTCVIEILHFLLNTKEELESE